MGNRKENLNRAIKKINSINNTKVDSVSSYYETEPFGTPDKQNKYINCCIKISTNLKPEILLEKCLQIEKLMGRTRPYRFAPRIIDIDLLLYENETINTPKLTLPHPRMKKRAFVLIPMNEICDDLRFKSWDFRKFLNTINITDKKSCKKYIDK
jgi:2-amino-4-hydroxy-6-hydroxymethyldihydropteridine diphosphokinase